MSAVGELRAALMQIRARLAQERQLIMSTLQPLGSAHNGLIAVWRGSSRQGIYQAAMQVDRAGEDVVKALAQIDFADRHIGEYLADYL